MTQNVFGWTLILSVEAAGAAKVDGFKKASCS